MKISERTIKRLGEIITGDKALSPYRSGRSSSVFSTTSAPTTPKRLRSPFKKALEIEPQDPISHFNLARLLKKLGLTAQARVHLNNALAIDPNYEKAHKLLSEIAFGSTSNE
jgi:hypothetical protein